MTETQQQRVAMAIGGLIALLGVTYYLDRQDIGATRTQCLAKSSPARCECIISVVTSDSSFLRAMPILGPVIFAPSEARQQENVQRAARVC